MESMSSINKIFLTGYMGAGKSFIAKQLREIINYELVDLDQLIVESMGLSIKEIFKKHGEAYFRNLEFDAVQKICKSPKAQIIDLGGGAFVQENICSLIGADKHAVSIYLKFDSEILAQRLENERNKRPMLAAADNLESFIADHLSKRSEFYERADLIINNEQESSLILNQIQSYLTYRN